MDCAFGPLPPTMAASLPVSLACAGGTEGLVVEAIFLEPKPVPLRTTPGRGFLRKFPAAAKRSFFGNFLLFFAN